MKDGKTKARGKEGNMDSKAKKPGGYHAGHRERMKKRFLADAPDNFEDHELLEMLLYYSVPRQNTNEAAHELLDRFKTIRGVLNASPENLMQVNKVGNNTYVLFRLVREVMRRYEATSDKTEKFDTAEKIGRFFIEKYIGVTNEVVYALFLDQSFGFVECKRLFEGSPSSASLDIKQIISLANALQTPNIVLAHNHPNGIAVPSSNDINTTLMLASALDMVDIRLLEHILVANKKYVALVKAYSDKGLLGEYKPVT